jgi:hypothetical protein
MGVGAAADSADRDDCWGGTEDRIDTAAAWVPGRETALATGHSPRLVWLDTAAALSLRP